MGLRIWWNMRSKPWWEFGEVEVRFGKRWSEIWAEVEVENEEWLSGRKREMRKLMEDKIRWCRGGVV